MARRFVVAAISCLIAFPAYAVIFEIRRNAIVRVEPDSSSAQIERIEATASNTVDARMVGLERENGFYRIIVPNTDEIGWISKSRGRLRPEEDRDTVQAFDRETYEHWIDEDSDCQDTREEVLIQESVTGVIFASSSECEIVSGNWIDPYSGDTFTDPGDLDVDHMIPLENAHISGGWNWTEDRRRDYANFMDDPDHLIAVSASENRSKGEKGPDEYMPSDDDYHCEYVEDWIRIKRDWGLRMTVNEAEATFRIHFECIAP